MYIPNSKKNLSLKEEKTANYFFDSPREMLGVENLKDALTSWRASEFRRLERDRKWYFYTTLLLLAIISYAVITDSPIMAITFILIGVVGYIHIGREPKILSFAINSRGIVIEKELYEFANLISFWILVESDEQKIISLKTRIFLAPYIHVPIGDGDPDEIRKALLKEIPEENHEPGLAEILSRILKF